MLLLLTTMVPRIVFIFAGHADGGFGTSDMTFLGTVGHRWSGERARNKLHRIFFDKAQITLRVSNKTAIVESNANVSCIPWNIRVSITNTAELAGLVYLFASLADR